MKTELIRPTFCFFCEEQMYYAGDERHTPELRITIESQGNNSESFYAHASCWNSWMNKRKQPNGALEK